MAFDLLEACLKHVLQELALDETNVPNVLFDAGIYEFTDLIRQKDRIEKGDISLRKPNSAMLLEAVEWHRVSFERNKKPSNILQDFSYDALEKFRKGSKHPQDRAGREIVTQLLLKNPESQTEEVMNYVGLTTSDLGEQNRVLHMIGEEVLKNIGFDFEAFTDDALKTLNEKTKAVFLINGPTQSGKSHVKSNVQCIGQVRKIPSFIITTGNQGRDNLADKLQGHLSGTQIGDKILTAPQVRKRMTEIKRKRKEMAKSSKRKMERFEQANEVLDKNGGSIVLANTPSQMDMISSIIKEERERDPDFEFLLIVDECDALVRTDDETQKGEQSYAGLRAWGPALTVMISATLSPFLLQEKWKDPERLRKGVKLYKIFPGDDYVGIEQFQPLEIDGEEQYLRNKELSLNSGYSYTRPEKDEAIMIPYSNPASMVLYKDAARHGGLLLDVTCSRVSRSNPGSVFEKAEKVDEALYYENGLSVGSVVLVGAGLFIKYPRKGQMVDGGDTQGSGRDALKYLEGTKVKKPRTNGTAIEGVIVAHKDAEYTVLFEGIREEKMKESEIEDIVCNDWIKFKSSERTVGDLIEHLFQHFKNGIFVYGFSMMQRGQSIRGTSVTPTHIFHSYGGGYSLPKVMQSLGRATFKGKHVMIRNGFHRVTVLARRDDLDATISNYDWLDMINPKDSDESLLDNIDGVKKRLPSAANFASRTPRKIGEPKGARERYNHDAFAITEDLVHSEELTKKRLWSNQPVQQMISTVDNLVFNADKGQRFDDKSIVEAHNDQFRDVGPIKLTQGRKLIRELLNANLMEKVTGESKDEMLYWCPYPSKLRLFINFEMFSDCKPTKKAPVERVRKRAKKLRVKVEDSDDGFVFGL